MNTTDGYLDFSEVPNNATFDPTKQSFWFRLQDGTSEIEGSMEMIEFMRILSVMQATSEGVQIGAAAMLLAAIFLMTKSEKRRSSVFCLNAVALLLVVIRGIFALLTITGPYYEFWRWVTHVYPNIGNAEVISAFGGVTTLLLVIAILLSLFVQVRIVCCNLVDRRRHLINVSNALVIVTAVALRFALTVVNIRSNLRGPADSTITRFDTTNKLGSAANITLVLSIAFSTVIFTAKLASAILARRSMGMKQFGPMQIIFVMGCQTMFTPLIFTIITYSVIKDSNIQSFVPTVVAVSLPLSGMWASVNTDNIHIANTGSRKNRVVPLGASDNSYGGSSRKGPSRTSTYYDDDKYGLTKGSPKKSYHANSDVDLEMQKIGDGVNVERSYSVTSG